MLLEAWHWHHAGRERIVHIHFGDAPNFPPEKAAKIGLGASLALFKTARV